MTPSRLLLILFVVVCSATGSSVAQQRECIEQTPAEKAVIDKAVEVLRQAFVDPLQQMGWTLTIDRRPGPQVAALGHPFRPLMLCNLLLELRFTLDPESDLAKHYADTLAEYAKQAENANGDMKIITAVTKNMARIRDLQNIQITATENYPYLSYGGPMGAGDRMTALHINGPSASYLEYYAPSSELDPPQETTGLLFGNWAGASAFKTAYIAFPFVHKQRSPFIENIQVRITTPSSNFARFFNKINWAELNAALTK